jgi:hypothetical protein
MTAGFVMALGLLLLRYGPLSLAWLERLPVAAVIAVIFAVLGKTVGIVLGRRRARRELARILAILTHCT